MSPVEVPVDSLFVTIAIAAEAAKESTIPNFKKVLLIKWQLWSTLDWLDILCPDASAGADTGADARAGSDAGADAGADADAAGSVGAGTGADSFGSAGSIGSAGL